MVSPYCSLLFSSIEVIKFSEVALLSFHCYCLIGCMMVAWWYRSWNTANTTADICLLIENGKKKPIEKKFIVFSNFLYQSFGCPEANLGSLTHSMIITTIVSIMTWSLLGDWQGSCVPKFDQSYQWDWSRKPSSSECNVLSYCVTLPKVYKKQLAIVLLFFFKEF